MNKIVQSLFANIFGDSQAEKISVKKNGHSSDRVLIGLPQGKEKGKVPAYQYVDVSISEFMPQNASSKFTIDHIGVADIDGDGRQDIYCDVSEEISARKKAVFGRSDSVRTHQVTIFNDDIQKIIHARLPELATTTAEETSSNLDWRVDRLERQMRGWEYSGLSLDFEREIDRLERRIAKIEEAATQETSEIKISDSERLLYDLDQIRAEIRALKENVDDVDEIEGRVSDLESNFDDLESRVDDLEGQINDRELKRH